MKESLEFYFNNCQQAMIHQNELSFELDDFRIILSFEISSDSQENDSDSHEDEFFSYHGIENYSDINELLERIESFSSFRIQEDEYLGWREDQETGKSISNEMYSIILNISNYRNDSIENYYSDIAYYGDPMCPDDGTYFFAIEITEKYWWDIEFANFVLKLSEINHFEVPDFYSWFFQKDKPIKDDKILPLITTNTKVRRLGYFKILSKFLLKYNKVPSTSINKKFEDFCSKYGVLLDENRYNKGLISSTKTGISAKPYIGVAYDFNFLNKINNIFYPGKEFKVYQALEAEYENVNNIFELSIFDKLYFLESILRSDYFYFSSLLELLFIKGKVTYMFLIETFQNKLISLLEEYKGKNSYGDRKVLYNFDSILNRIKKWNKADVYLEHILMPRLNWMLDFGIITFKNSEFVITEIGIKLFRHLLIWNDINAEKVVSPDGFLDRFMIHLFDDCFNEGKIHNPKDINIILEKMYNHIGNSFEIFKTLAPNRVTASQSANYSKYKLYLNDEIKVGFQFIISKLSEKEQDKYIFRYQEQYQDGYIQKKN